MLTGVTYTSNMKDQNVLLGKRIAEARERRQWNKAELARRAGISPSYVTRIEKGEFDRPSIEQIKLIAGALGVLVTDLTDFAPDPVSSGIEAELRAMFQPDEAPLVAELLQKLARHDARRRRFLLGTMKPLVLDFPDTDR